MFDNALGGPAVTVGLVAIIFLVCGAVIAVLLFAAGRLARVEKRCLSRIDAVETRFLDAMGAGEQRFLGAIAALKGDLERRIADVAHETASLKDGFADFKIEVVQKYVSREGAREMLDPVLSEMRLRFDQVDEMIQLKRLSSKPRSSPRRKPAA